MGQGFFQDLDAAVETGKVDWEQKMIKKIIESKYLKLWQIRN